MSAGAVKTCSKCGETKPVEQFHTKRAACKPCHAERRRQIRAENRDKINERRRQIRAENRDKINERQRQIRAENRDKINEYRRQYTAENRDKINERHRRGVFTLNDTYVAKKITTGTTLTRADIPPELLEAKRLQLKLKRIAREAMK